MDIAALRGLTRRIVAVALAGLSGAVAATAAQDLKLAGVFGDHMVLQRDAPIRVWGTAAAGESVRVSLRGVTRQAKASSDGRWAALLPALPAGGPHELKVSVAHAELLVLRDVLIGDVWICSGQSNMEWMLADSQDAARELAAADVPQIRHVKVAHRASLEPQDDIEPAPWQVSKPQTAGTFSAVAYYFARRLQSGLGVPIGLVNVSWGGTHIETWTSARAALTDPDLASTVRAMPCAFPASPAP